MESATAGPGWALTGNHRSLPGSPVCLHSQSLCLLTGSLAVFPGVGCSSCPSGSGQWLLCPAGCQWRQVKFQKSRCLRSGPIRMRERQSQSIHDVCCVIIYAEFSSSRLDLKTFSHLIRAFTWYPTWWPVGGATAAAVDAECVGHRQPGDPTHSAPGHAHFLTRQEKKQFISVMLCPQPIRPTLA